MLPHIVQLLSLLPLLYLPPLPLHLVLVVLRECLLFALGVYFRLERQSVSFVLLLHLLLRPLLKQLLFFTVLDLQTSIFDWLDGEPLAGSVYHWFEGVLLLDQLFLTAVQYLQVLRPLLLVVLCSLHKVSESVEILRVLDMFGGPGGFDGPINLEVLERRLGYSFILVRTNGRRHVLSIRGKLKDLAHQFVCGLLQLLDEGGIIRRECFGARFEVWGGHIIAINYSGGHLINGDNLCGLGSFRIWAGSTLVGKLVRVAGRSGWNRYD